MAFYPERLGFTGQFQISRDRPEEEWKNHILPLGFKFCPTDKELIGYLDKKIKNLFIKPGIFCDLNVYKHEPDKLSQFAFEKHLGGKMYFFSPVKRKDGSMSKNERTVLDKGFWKASTKKGRVSTLISGTANGSKAALVYHSWEVENGEKVKKKQNWLMKEYRLDKQVADQDDCVMTLCVIYYNLKSRNERRSD